MDPRSEVTCTQRPSKRSFVRVVSVVLKTSIKKIWIARRITSGPNQRAIVFWVLNGFEGWSWMVLRVTERFPIKKNFCYNSHENFYFPMYGYCSSLVHPLFPYFYLGGSIQSGNIGLRDKHAMNKVYFQLWSYISVVFNSKSFKI